MRILICGGRNFNDVELMKEVLFQNFYPGDVLIHGNAKGADQLSEKLSQPYVEIERYPADWKKYGIAAGPIRNKQMLDEGKPDLIIAFPGGSGTRNMIEQARIANIPVKMASSTESAMPLGATEKPVGAF